jgi:hypothetical protein
MLLLFNKHSLSGKYLFTIIDIVYKHFLSSLSKVLELLCWPLIDIILVQLDIETEICHKV